MMKKRGISPLIATVLIIGFTVALGAVVMTWGGKFIGNIQEESARTADVKITCIQDIDLNIRNACIFGNNVEMLIENKGSQKVESFTFRIKGTEGRASIESEGIGLGAAEIKQFTTYFKTEMLKGIGIVNAIDVFPRIKSSDGEKLETCRETTIPLRNCEDVPLLSDANSWNFRMVKDADETTLNIVKLKDSESGPYDGIGDILNVNDFISQLKTIEVSPEVSFLQAIAVATYPTDSVADALKKVEEDYRLTVPYILFTISNYKAERYKIIMESAPFVVPQRANFLCISGTWLVTTPNLIEMKLVLDNTKKTECVLQDPATLSPGLDLAFKNPQTYFGQCYPLDSRLELGISCPDIEEVKGKKASFVATLNSNQQYHFMSLTRFCFAEVSDTTGSCIL